MTHTRRPRIETPRITSPIAATSAPAYDFLRAITPSEVHLLPRKPSMTPARAVPSDVKAAVLDALRAAFTEERTDALIAKVTSKLPWWAKWVPIGAALDRILPGVLLSFVDEHL